PLDPKVLDEVLARLTGPSVCESELLERMGGKRELVQRVFDVFLESLEPWQRDVDDAISSRDGDKLRRVAHQIKGAVANLAARRAIATAKMLEDLGKSGNLSPAQRLRDQLMTELGRVKSALERMCAS